MDTNTVFAKVYLSTQTLLRTLVTDLIESLEDFGCGARSDRALFSTNIRRVMLKLAHCPAHEAPLATFELPGASLRDKRLALLKEVVVGFGGNANAATSIANLAVNGNEEILGRLESDGSVVVRLPKVFCLMRMRISHLHGDALKLHGRLKEVLATINKPYLGTPMNPDAGVEQVVDLMQRFPDLADTIYKRLGFRSTTSFPPEAIGIAGDAERIFVKAANAQVDSKWWWNTFKVAGLIIASVAITVITAGTLGTLAASVVGSGIGLSQGVAHVIDTNNKLQHTRDAHRYDAATQESVEHAQGEVQGAWGMLIVDTATGGLLGRFGGGPALSNAMKVLRVTAISGVGSGLATATNPNVWRSEKTTSLIIFATVVGGVSGAGGHYLASGIAHVIPKLGAKIQIGVSKIDGHLAQGKTVKVQLRESEAPVSAKVVSVNSADSTVMLKVEGQDLHVRVGKVVKLDGDVFHDEAFLKALRPMTKKDFVMMRNRAYQVKPGADPQLGEASCENGRFFFQTMGSSKKPAKLEELRIFEEHAYTPPKHIPKSIPKKDHAHFKPTAKHYQIAPLKANSGYYSVVRKQGRCNEQPKLRIVPGRDMDGGLPNEGGFFRWMKEGLPRFDMRNHPVKTGPTPDEIAVFMAHGNTTNFAGISTRKAARAMADAIFDTNRKVGTKTPIRYCALSSCNQGNRRYFVVGKTNAEVFQKQLDMRLRELGIDPTSSQGITVLASDRMGSIHGADLMKKNKFSAGGRTTFVPAGSQKPLSYRGDVAHHAVQIAKQGFKTAKEGLKVVGLTLASATGTVLVISAIANPDEFMDALERFGDYILGFIVDCPVMTGVRAF